MKTSKLISAVLTNLLLAALFAIAFAPILGAYVGTVFLIVFALGLIPKGSTGGVFAMAIQKEIWTDYILGNLFKGNDFMNLAFNADQYVLAGSVVHIPQAGAKATVVKNRSSLPATVILRTDTDVTYALDEYTTDPTLIKEAEKVELSYDKINSVLGEHMDGLRETTGDNLIYNWRPTVAGQILRTTGGDVTAHLPSATGNRKKFVKEDLQKARTLLNKQNIAKEERYALISSDMFDQIMSDADLIKRDYAGEMDMKNGVIVKLFGFNIIERSSTLVYDNTGTPVPKAVGAAGAATDNDSVICWQKNAVERALGTVDFFEDVKSPLYFGDVYSALLRMGGRKRRTNGEGVVAIVQAAGS